jgi:hypothetical protein
MFVPIFPKSGGIDSSDLPKMTFLARLRRCGVIGTAHCITPDYVHRLN